LFHKKFSFLRSLNGCIFLIRQHFSVPDDGIQMKFVKSPFSVAGLFFYTGVVDRNYVWLEPALLSLHVARIGSLRDIFLQIITGKEIFQ
jgi:hypothetical protein